MPKETKNREATVTRPSEGRKPWKDLLGGFSTGGSDVKDAWESPEKEVQRLSTLKLTQTKASRVDSLLSDDVFPWKGCARHSSHLHMVSDLREVQAQVHSMDGHTSTSFRWS